MPYVKDRTIARPETPGELNYFLTTEAARYLERRGLSYATLNEVVGALECCKLEMYRRVFAPYEDKKMLENGDAYPASVVTKPEGGR